MSFHSRDSAIEKAKNSSREYLKCSEFLDRLNAAKNDTGSYSTRNGYHEAPQVLALLNHDVTDRMRHDTPQPKVTEQIMVLQEITFSVV